MYELKFIFYLVPIINLSIGILALFSLSYNEYSYDKLFLIALSGIFMLLLNLYYNKYTTIKNKNLKLFSMLSIFLNFSIIPTLLFYLQFDFISYKILNYFLLLLYPVCSSIAFINDFIKNKNTVFDILLVASLYAFFLIIANKNISNILPAIFIILVSVLMILNNSLENFKNKN